MKRKKLISVLLCVTLLSSCAKPETEYTAPARITAVPAESVVSDTTALSEATTTITTTTAVITEPPEPEFLSATILCAGDNLIHSPIYNQAKSRSEDGGYDFTYAYENTAQLVAEADLAILNQETIISDNYEPSNFPFFCSPESLAEEMTEIGFDAISVSNNHCLDQGEEGLISSLTFWRENYPNIPVYGAYLNEADMSNIRTLEVNGITFAFLGYMEHTNGLYLPSGAECELVYISEEELIKSQVEQAATLADCVIVSVHFGVEVSNTVTQQQYDFSQKLADWGADIIIGTQPHTIQSMEYLDCKDGRQAFVFYCLGNYISAMDIARSMVGMLGRITVTKDTSTGEITLSDANALPIITHYDNGYRNVRVYPFSDYTEELGAAHGCIGAGYDYFRQLIDENIPKEFLSE